MGLFDLPAPLFSGVDHLLGLALPPLLRLVLWGVLAGWLTMLVYRRLSNQDKIQRLKKDQKEQQKTIANFDGEFSELMPEIRFALGLGLRQLGLSLGPALLATIPVLFLIVWVSGQFAYLMPETGSQVGIEIEPVENTDDLLAWAPPGPARRIPSGWTLTWPAPESPVRLLQEGEALFELPLQHSIPIIHKRQWWNWLVANPIGYIPEEAVVEAVEFDLPTQQFLSLGPDWMRGWVFVFFSSFLLSSIGFKIGLKID